MLRLQASRTLDGAKSERKGAANMNNVLVCCRVAHTHTGTRGVGIALRSWVSSLPPSVRRVAPRGVFLDHTHSDGGRRWSSSCRSLWDLPWSCC